MSALPTVDVNLFVYNGAASVAGAIDSVLAQTWPAVSLTLIDDGSSDGTAEILLDYARRDPKIRLKRNRCNGGAVANFQRAFWMGDADYVMPKSGDDLIAPDFIEKTMAVLLACPQAAMCHARGHVFTADAGVRYTYPPEHALHAVGADRLARAMQVMRTYTTSPSFWGVYRRDAVDRLARIRDRAGWDHVLLAELALYGEIRHVPEILYRRRDGGKPVLHLARAATEQASRGLDLTGPLSEHLWRTPLITTAFAHLENFAAARLPEAERLALLQAVPRIFRARWLPAMRNEAAALRAALPELLAAMTRLDRDSACWMAGNLATVVQATQQLLPEEDMTLIQVEIAALAGDAAQRPIAA